MENEKKTGFCHPPVGIDEAPGTLEGKTHVGPNAIRNRVTGVARASARAKTPHREPFQRHGAGEAGRFASWMAPSTYRR